MLQKRAAGVRGGSVRCERCGCRGHRGCRPRKTTRARFFANNVEFRALLDFYRLRFPRSRLPCGRIPHGKPPFSLCMDRNPKTYDPLNSTLLAKTSVYENIRPIRSASQRKTPASPIPPSACGRPTGRRRRCPSRARSRRWCRNSCAAGGLPPPRGCARRRSRTRRARRSGTR